MLLRCIGSASAFWRLFRITLCLYGAAQGASQGVSLFAQTPKVGFVNSATIRERSPEYQNAKQRIESIVNDWKKQIDDQQTAIHALETDVVKKRLIWSEAELKEKEQALAKKRFDKEDLVRKKFNSGGDFDTLVIATMKPIEAKIAAAIQEVGITEGYDYVWDKTTQPLLYANPRFDLTVKVMEKLGLYTDDIKAKLQETIDKIDREIKKAREELSPTSVRRKLNKAIEDAKKIGEDAAKDFSKEFKDATKDIKDMIEQPKDSTKPRTNVQIPRDGGGVKADTTKSDTTKSIPPKK
jgi:Skp family chaperone for outer membrane proteins